MTDSRPVRTRARALFLEAIDLDVEARDPFVRERCGGDESLLRAVRALLSADDPEFLETPAYERAGVTEPDLERVAPLERVGQYRILEEIGEGGMGIVYLAQQEESVRRRVALKLIKPGMDSRAIIERFEAERQALALMDHPGIARVFDAGTTEAGHPYFVMEYVAGVSVTEYCDRHRLSVRARVELMIEICHAVQHAHQKGIIHRDLKSSNVLVTVSGDRAAPKIIDFGLAKAIGPSPLERREFTWIGGFVGSLETMSPEQAGATGLDIDTRADVYSLGALLYALLAGALPFDRDVVDEALLSGHPERLFANEPPLAGARVTGLPSAAEVAHRRRTTPAGLVRKLRGDLDRICATAMEYDRTRRYATPTALAQDLVRHLADEPIVAAPPSVSYRLSKFLKRRKDVVTSAAAVLGVLIGAIVVTTHARVEAEREAEHARQMTEFLTWAFTSVDPNHQIAHPDLKVVDLLNRAADELDGGFLVDSPPDVEARIRAVLGETLHHLGRLDEAESQLRGSWTSHRDRDPDSVTTLEAANRYALLLIDQNRVEEAEPILRDALTRWERVADRDHPGAVTARNGVASVLYLTGALAEAEEMQRETLEIVRRSGRDDDERTLQSMFGLGRLLGSQLRFVEARDLFRELLLLQQRARGAEHPAALRTMNALAETLGRTGDFDGAEELWLGTHATMKKVLGPDHPLTLRVALNIGEFRVRMRGDPAGAEPFLREALEGAKRTLDRDHPLVASARYDLGECLYDQQRWDGAEPLLRETVDWLRRHRDAADDGTFAALMRLRRVWLCQGRLAEIEANCHELLATLGDGVPYPTSRGNLLLELGVCLRHRGDHDEAIRTLFAALESWGDGGGVQATTSARTVLAQCLIEAGRPDEAADQLDTLDAICAEAFGAESDAALRVIALRGRLLRARGDLEGAEESIRRAADLAARNGSPATAPWVAGVLAEVLVERGKEEEARAEFERAFEGLRAQIGVRHPSVHRLAEQFAASLDRVGDTARAAEVRALLE